MERFKKMKNKYIGFKLFKNIKGNATQSSNSDSKAESIRSARVSKSHGRSDFHQLSRKQKVGNAFFQAIGDLKSEYHKSQHKEIKKSLFHNVLQSRDESHKSQGVTLSWLAKQKPKVNSARNKVKIMKTKHDLPLNIVTKHENQKVNEESEKRLEILFENEQNVDKEVS